MKGEPITDYDLNAYIDGQLDAERAADVEVYLAEQPDEADRLRDYQAINRQLRNLHSEVLQQPVPKRLLRSGRRRLQFWKSVERIAAVLALVLVGGVGGWLVRDQLSPQAPAFAQVLVEEAVLAHSVYTPERRHAVEVPAAEEPHLVAWLSKRFDSEIRAPKLDALGYELLGGRLLAVDFGPAAHFMYQDADGRRLTLFVRKGRAEDEPNDATPFRFVKNQNTNAFYWLENGLGYALIGDMEQSALAEVADVIYQQLLP